jgi:hypothetical protein
LTADASTILSNDEYAVADLTSSYCCKELAAKFTRTSKSTLEGEVINYLSKVDYYIRLSKEYEDRFKSHFGIGSDGSPSAACEIGDWDMTFPWGEELLIHTTDWQ